MEKFYEQVVRWRKPIVIGFLIMTLVCAICRNLVSVNYDIISYLPDESLSTQALNVMEEEFDDGITNARAMVSDVTIPQALEYKTKIAAVSGVSSVTWLDDAVNIATPLESIDKETLETYYRDNTALFSIVIDEDSYVNAVADIRNIIGENNALAGNAVNIADGTTNTVSEINVITIIAIVFVFIVLSISTNSWAEPIVVLIGLGVAILVNGGTNLIFGEISFITNSAGSVLQLAVSLDYSVFLIHRFSECLKAQKGKKDPAKAMVEALTKSTVSILSSGTTTVIGFLAVILMSFKIGPDVGLALAKGVVISLLTVFFFMPGIIMMTYKWMEKTTHRSLLPDFSKFGEIISKITLPLVAVFIVVVVPAYLAYNANDFYYGSSRMFSSSSRTGADALAIEDKFGETDTYVILVPTGNTINEQALSDSLHKLPEVTSIISYVDTVGRAIPTSYLNSDTLAKLDSGKYRRMVISVNVPIESEETFTLVEKIRNIAAQYYGDTYYLAGSGVSTYDLRDTITADMLKVNIVAIAAVFIILAITLRSILVPLVIVLAIETAICLNLGFPYLAGETVFYTAYLIISSIQLGSTVDYAILLTNRYKENRRNIKDKRKAIKQTVADVTSSILVSGLVMTAVGFLIGIFSSNQLLAQLGVFIGRGAVLSMIIVIFVLPGMLCLLDKFVTKNKTIKAQKEAN